MNEQEKIAHLESELEGYKLAAMREEIRRLTAEYETARLRRIKRQLEELIRRMEKREAGLRSCIGECVLALRATADCVRDGADPDLLDAASAAIGKLLERHDRLYPREVRTATHDEAVTHNTP